jgi:Papain family cysteine protease
MAKTKRARSSGRRPTSTRSTSSVDKRLADAPPVIRSQAARRGTTKERVLDARPDTLDFRDRMFEPTLIEVQTEQPLDEYRKMKVPILDQGTEGACTGFGLATVVHYLLRTRDVIRDDQEVSPRMLYDMARRYDEWPGEKYSGSSARGAMKGWHKHGICSRPHWIYDRKLEKQDSKLYAQRFEDALRRPLGAYFRVNHKDLVAMHAAISEVGILYATSQVHEGWQNVGTDGVIQWAPDAEIIGGHAFAIVAYDQRGFWIQNSWADDWGKNGYAQISYDDWLANGSDIWVARLGAPVILRAKESVSRAVGVAAQGSRSYVFCDLRPHIISLGNNGALKPDGTFGTSAEDVKEIFSNLSDRIDSNGSVPIKHLLLYAHGGLTAEDSAIQKVADLRPTLLDAGVFPIAFIWRTDLWTTIRNILQDAVARRRPEGFLDNTKDFMLDRLDDGLEPIARAAGGHRVWAEMQQNAMLASQKNGGLLVVLNEVKALTARHSGLKVHLVGHSAGSILLGGLAGANQAGGRSVTFDTCTMWAPACTMSFYREQYLPAIRAGSIKQFAIFTLTDRAEQDDNCANIYHKSLLYLVSNAFEEVLRKPWFGGADGVPLLGMQKFVNALPERDRPKEMVLSPNTVAEGRPGAARSTTHGDFDDDGATLKATLARILGESTRKSEFTHHRSEAAQRRQRQAIMLQTRAV